MRLSFAPPSDLMPAGVVDHLDRRAWPAATPAHADLRHASGGRVKRADIDRIGRPAAHRHRAERACGEYAARLQEEIRGGLAVSDKARSRPALSLTECLRCFFMRFPPARFRYRLLSARFRQC